MERCHPGHQQPGQPAGADRRAGGGGGGGGGGAGGGAAPEAGPGLPRPVQARLRRVRPGRGRQDLHTGAARNINTISAVSTHILCIFSSTHKLLSPMAHG